MVMENDAYGMQGAHLHGSDAASRPSSNPAADRNKSYFTDVKKGEVNELMNMLKLCTLGRDPTETRIVIKKVIAYMTLGIDVSRLFSQMVMAIETKDLVVKKMVYLYLCNYAASNSELAIMCINTLQRDCSNEDPMVRGLALRSLCGLRIASAVEYMIDPLRKGLEDSNSYVRKTAVIGVLRLFHFNRAQVEENGLVDSIYVMLKDGDHQVVTNCLYALQEMMSDEGGMAVNQSMILGLLSCVEIFSEWGLCQVIDLVTRYDPIDEEEVFTIMNILDPVLRTNNSGVVLSTMKCFLHLTRHSLSLQVGGSTEIVHCILAHLDILIPRCPGLYDEDFRLFYVRDNEPQNIKHAKVKLLSLLANQSNVSEIISELSAYVDDIDTVMSSAALKSIAHIAYRCPESVPLAKVQLAGFLDASAPHIKAGAVIALQQLLAKYPDWRGDGIPRLRSVFQDLQDAEARAAAVWMVGYWGAEIQEAPYILEKIIDAYKEESVAVKRILLTATVRLFFIRPPEVQAMLGRLMPQALNDVASRDIQDRALFYTRLLKTGVHTAKSIICADLPPIRGEFEEDKRNPVKEAIFEEFNSLSILYGELSQDFILPKYQVKGCGVELLGAKGPSRAFSEGTGTVSPLDIYNSDLKIEPNTAQQASPSLSGGMLLDVGPSSNTNDTPTEPIYFGNPENSKTGQQGVENLLSGMHGELRATTTKDNGTEEHGVDLSADHVAMNTLCLIHGEAVDQNNYQSLWTKLPELNTIQNKRMGRILSSDDLQHCLASRHIYTIATGEDDKAIKLFLYCESHHGLLEPSGGSAAARALHLVQCNINKAMESYSIIVKSTTEDQTLGQSVAVIMDQELNRAHLKGSSSSTTTTTTQLG